MDAEADPIPRETSLTNPEGNRKFDFAKEAPDADANAPPRKTNLTNPERKHEIKLQQLSYGCGRRYNPWRDKLAKQWKET